MLVYTDDKSGKTKLKIMQKKGHGKKPNSSAGHPAHSSLRKESPAELMLLNLVWDKTASGTARSKTGNGLHS